jgi:hypothetical protein
VERQRIRALLGSCKRGKVVCSVGVPDRVTMAELGGGDVVRRRDDDTRSINKCNLVKGKALLKMATTPTNTVLCPLDNRRESREFLVKLFVVHFTTVGSFFHLLYLRHESIVTAAPVLYLLCPLGFVAQHAVAISVLVLYNAGLILLIQHQPDWSATLHNPIAWFTGKFISHERVPTMQIGNEARSVEYYAIRAGHVLLVIAFLVQCAGSVALYVRRRTYDLHAVTFVDQMVFELAVSGLLVGILTLWSMLNPTAYRLDTVSEDSAKGLDKAMVIIGHRYGAFITKFKLFDKNTTVLRACSAAIISGLLFVVLGELKMRWFPQGWYFASMDDGLMKVFIILVRIMIVLLLLAGLMNFEANVFFFGLPVAVIICSFPIMICGVGINRYVRLFVEIRDLQNWPVDRACPMLWKDAHADFIWWLA